jgi:hypothetical protein
MGSFEFTLESEGFNTNLWLNSTRGKKLGQSDDRDECVDVRIVETHLKDDSASSMIDPHLLTHLCQVASYAL